MIKIIRKWKLLTIIITLSVTTITCSRQQTTSEAEEKTDSYGVSDPVVDENGVITWDCVYFGNYWQNDTNKDGKADQNDQKEPIKWRVLSLKDDDAFLIADQNLDSKPYNDKCENVTWGKCTMRIWLNDYFLNNAFSEEEKKEIKDTVVANDNNEHYSTEGGVATTDKVYLLSITEAINKDYGFEQKFESESLTRQAKNTAYAQTCGAGTCTDEEYRGKGNWWLRSPGYDSSCAAAINTNGYGSYVGSVVNGSSLAIRPVLHLKLSSSLWKKAGKVTSVDKEEYDNVVPTPTVTPISNKGDSVEQKNTDKTSEVQTTGKQQVNLVDKIRIPSKVVLKSVKNVKGRRVLLKWKRVKNVKGYQISYSTNKKFKRSTKIKYTIKTTFTVKKMKKKKIYYVRIRAYTILNGKKVYGKWSSAKKIKISK